MVKTQLYRQISMDLSCRHIDVVIRQEMTSQKGENINTWALEIESVSWTVAGQLQARQLASKRLFICRAPVYKDSLQTTWLLSVHNEYKSYMQTIVEIIFYVLWNQSFKICRGDDFNSHLV